MEYLSLDADHAGHLMVELDRYKDRITEEFETAELGCQEYAAEMEHIGWLSAKLELCMITQEEMEMIKERIGEDA